ncbi:MAG: hypothetical protein HN975_11940 [Anaerolineae bacterium]|jgi:hypothetical protein|nr:hypothetical protein [Anaerolineae bacterium]
MSTTATQTYEQGIQNLQAWLDFLAIEEEKLGVQLSKMQGGSGVSLPEIDADTPPLAAEYFTEHPPESQAETKTKPEKWT